jgi:NAD(P)H-nitrite reductase large subunit
MVVCSCKGVSDRAVTAAIADGASTVDDITGRCKAGGHCGGCWPELERLLTEVTAPVAIAS